MSTPPAEHRRRHARRAPRTLSRAAVDRNLAVIAWAAPARWWHGNAPEWDLVAGSLDGRRVLLGEAKLSVSDTRSAQGALASRPPPAGLPSGVEVVRALFAAAHGGGASQETLLVDAADLLQ